ncbi:MAG: thioredoxin domain-containing protein [Desulfobacterales bacterium CG23_combo_of_CG06-09_8_20_14_all_52_9]|nr:MAG: thioredoxin domain-containing protein [Desulfobacterales bacterium CG23_combo_of_CG06-09_8_20_14_all_52_9]
MTEMQQNKENQPNHLIHEKSPYLLQHAYNPVDWYPWSPEALMRAKTEDRPILLSIGYSTCHWCHVMERESFSDSEIAHLMNNHFVCIKLDREERPDLDQIYITAVSAIRGSAGWPLNVFLTPDLKPFYGGTYFPPKRRPGITSWQDILELLAKAWKDPSQRKKILNSADELDTLIRKHLVGDKTTSPMEAHLLEEAYQALEKRYDPAWGGFSPAPKFPSPPIQAFLFYFFNRASQKGSGGSQEGQQALDMALHTLKSMAEGGIYDSLGGGFHRYATDSRWRIPHFEKMLYDNAQLVLNYLTAFQITQNSFFKKIAEETLAWVDREMTYPKGGFYSAQDADSLPHTTKNGKGSTESVEKREGAFYVWTLPEIVEVLGEKEAALFSYHYGVLPAGNALEDPHGEFFGKNILFQAHTPKETSQRFQIPEESVTVILDAARNRLLEERDRRPRPHLDDKIITAWNGLMISAWALSYQVFKKASYLSRAKEAAEFIWKYLYDEKEKRLFRIWREGERKIPGMAEDYAAYIQGLLDTYEADFDIQWLHRASTLAQILIDIFFDREHGGFFMNPVSEQERTTRIKEIHDGVIPSAASTAALALFRLYRFTQNNAFLEAAEATVQSVVPTMRQSPIAAPLMLMAAEYLLGGSFQVIVAGNPKDPVTLRMLEVAHALYHPGKTLIVIDSQTSRMQWAKWLPFIPNIPLEDEKPMVYFCKDQTCSLPIETPEALRNILNSHKEPGSSEP